MLKMHIDSIKEKDPDFKGGIIVDALSASGLRAIRFAKELDNVRVIFSFNFESSFILMILAIVRINL
jgi:tRNA G26 N,N-dimethylase Trm1